MNNFCKVPKPVQGRLFTLPKTEKEKKAWIHRCGRPIDNFKGDIENIRICCKHFLRSAYNENLLSFYERQEKTVPKKIRPLLPTALPTLYIPQQHTDAKLSVERDQRLSNRQKPRTTTSTPKENFEFKE